MYGADYLREGSALNGSAEDNCREVRSEDVYSNAKTALTALQEHCTSEVINFKTIKKIAALYELLQTCVDITYQRYEQTETYWAEGYPSATCAISQLTHQSSGNARKAISRAEIQQEFSCVHEALHSGEITNQHVDQIARICKDPFYVTEVESNIELIVDNAKATTANEFATVIQHFKYNVQNINEEQWQEFNQDDISKCSVELTQYHSGYWNLNGHLDPVGGTKLSKALEDIADQIFRSSSKEQRHEDTKGQRFGQALGALANGYVSHDKSALTQTSSAASVASYHFTPSIHADLIIETSQISSDKSSREFLQGCLTRKTPLLRAHSKQFLKQVLCDSVLSFPVKKSDKQISLGSKVRVAPASMKRALAIEQNSCYIEGCGVPAKWCDAHHIDHWIDGGQTKIENMALLCNKHHHMLHNNRDWAQIATYKLKEMKNQDSQLANDSQLGHRPRSELENTS